MVRIFQSLVRVHDSNGSLEERHNLASFSVCGKLLSSTGMFFPYPFLGGFINHYCRATVILIPWEHNLPTNGNVLSAVLRVIIGLRTRFLKLGVALGCQYYIHLGKPPSCYHLISVTPWRGIDNCLSTICPTLESSCLFILIEYVQEENTERHCGNYYWNPQVPVTSII